MYSLGRSSRFQSAIKIAKTAMVRTATTMCESTSIFERSSQPPADLDADEAPWNLLGGEQPGSQLGAEGSGPWARSLGLGPGLKYRERVQAHISQG